MEKYIPLRKQSQWPHSGTISLCGTFPDQATFLLGYRNHSLYVFIPNLLPILTRVTSSVAWFNSFLTKRKKFKSHFWNVFSLCGDLWLTRTLFRREGSNCRGNNFVDESRRPIATKTFIPGGREQFPVLSSMVAKGHTRPAERLKCGLEMCCEGKAPTRFGRLSSTECEYLTNNFILTLCCNDNTFDIVGKLKWTIKINFTVIFYLMRILENLLHLWVAFVDILFLLFGTVLGCSCPVVCCGLSASLLSGCFLLCRMGGERLMDLSEWRAFCGGAGSPHDTWSWWSSVPALGDFVSCLSVQFCLGALHSPRNRKKKGLQENWPYCWHLAYLLEPGIRTSL